MEFNHKGLKTKPLNTSHVSGVDSISPSVQVSYEPRENSRELADLDETPRSPNLGCSLFVEDGKDFGQSGHISDPGTGRKAPFWGSPKLKRSCSNLETGKVMASSASKFGESLENFRPGSPPVSCHSADRVMLKKHSSSQILPSGSRKIWWKLFLWSHRNLHKPSTAKSTVPDRQGGYSSDTLEQSLASKAGVWPRNHWVANAFSVESRVDQWVQDIEIQPQSEDDYAAENGIDYPPSPESHKSPARNTIQVAHDVAHANSVILSLNSSSTVAHICGTSLKVIPSLSPFSSLRTVDLSNNYIVSINPGSLPKGLHAINLARNKINSIEGLREVTRLRVVDLSYNRISRIGQGLSNCTSIKELYLSGNKISDVEGLHRLLKLTVLDLSFNKITTTKALGQLVANYMSLQALNLLGNPVQTNISDEQLRKAVNELLPNIKYLNKQSIKPERAREVAMDSVARAALGHSSGSSFRHRRLGRRIDTVGGGSSSTCIAQKSITSTGAKRSNNIGKKRRGHSSKGRSSLTPKFVS
ncbi:Protein phosphatase 1 regulatory subunit SDS22 homolog [Linum perenne]